MQLPKYAQTEIERRWMVLVEPYALIGPSDRARCIEDRYLEGGRLRLRRITETGQPTCYKLGKKYPGQDPLEAPVVTVYLSQAEFESLLQLPGHDAVKRRYAVAGGSLDVYLQPQHGFAVFEREFSSPQAASSYAPPGFCATEITGDPRCTGYALARQVLVGPQPLNSPPQNQ